MRQTGPPCCARGRAHSGAFSLIEIIVVVGLMSVIILGLVMMFTQTQRAYKLGTTQVDVLEGGRAVTDMITRELLQVAPARASNAVNFYVFLPNIPPLQQELSGSPSVQRTNVIEDLYFLTRENQKWISYGYHIGSRAAGMGTLYRYEQSDRVGLYPGDMFLNCTDYMVREIYTNRNRPIDLALNLNINRVLEGVVHFKVRAYNTNGFWLTNGLLSGAEVVMGVAGDPLTAVPGETRYYCMSNSVVPASVELELGILEDATVAKAKAIPDLTARRNYLSNQVARVHLFRIRVPIRNVDATVYQ